MTNSGDIPRPHQKKVAYGCARICRMRHSRCSLNLFFSLSFSSATLALRLLSTNSTPPEQTHTRVNNCVIDSLFALRFVDFDDAHINVYCYVLLCFNRHSYSLAQISRCILLASLRSQAVVLVQFTPPRDPCIPLWTFSRRHSLISSSV